MIWAAAEEPHRHLAHACLRADCLLRLTTVVSMC